MQRPLIYMLTFLLLLTPALSQVNPDDVTWAYDFDGVTTDSTGVYDAANDIIDYSSSSFGQSAVATAPA